MNLWQAMWLFQRLLPQIIAGKFFEWRLGLFRCGCTSLLDYYSSKFIYKPHNYSYQSITDEKTCLYCALRISLDFECQWKGIKRVNCEIWLLEWLLQDTARPTSNDIYLLSENRQICGRFRLTQDIDSWILRSRQGLFEPWWTVYPQYRSFASFNIQTIVLQKYDAWNSTETMLILPRPSKARGGLRKRRFLYPWLSMLHFRRWYWTSSCRVFGWMCDHQLWK